MVAQKAPFPVYRMGKRLFLQISKHFISSLGDIISPVWDFTTAQDLEQYILYELDLTSNSNPQTGQSLFSVIILLVANK